MSWGVERRRTLGGDRSQDATSAAAFGKTSSARRMYGSAPLVQRKEASSAEAQTDTQVPADAQVDATSLDIESESEDADREQTNEPTELPSGDPDDDLAAQASRLMETAGDKSDQQQKAELKRKLRIALQQLEDVEHRIPQLKSAVDRRRSRVKQAEGQGVLLGIATGGFGAPSAVERVAGEKKKLRRAERKLRRARRKRKSLKKQVDTLKKQLSKM